MQKQGTVEDQHIDQLRVLSKFDLFFLLVFTLGRRDMLNDWCLHRCQEVQMDPNDNIDLWAREHYKTTIISYGLTIQDIIKNPDITFGIFSHTRPMAKSFLRDIKWTFESNRMLIALFPNIFWENTNSAPKWAEDDGIVVKRRQHRKEATVEAWGLVDGMPTGKHFDVLLYDDVVTDKTVNTPDMIRKAMSAVEMSYNLGARGGVRRFVGTRYHANDPYGELIKRKTAVPRLYPGTKDGTVGGEPVFLTKEELVKKRRDMGPYIFSSQILLNPVADEAQNFKKEWLRKHQVKHWDGMNCILLFDPANEKKKDSDYTGGWCVYLGRDNNVYIRDMARDRLNLSQRWDLLFDWHQKYKPKQVRYEKYGLQSDIEHFQSKMTDENYHFDIQEVGGQVKKDDRIRRLIPWFEQSRIWLPRSLNKTIYDGTTIDVVDVFLNEEYLPFPVSNRKDLFDALARLAEPELKLPWPMQDADQNEPEKSEGHATSWMRR